MLGGCVFLFLGAAVVLGSLPRMQWAAVLAAHGGSLLCTVLAGLVLAATLVLAFAGRSRKR